MLCHICNRLTQGIMEFHGIFIADVPGLRRLAFSRGYRQRFAIAAYGDRAQLIGSEYVRRGQDGKRF